MEKINVDNGQSFDFGKTSKEYAKYRDIYPKELYDRIYQLGVGKRDSDWLDLGTGTGVIPRGLAEHGARIIGTDISENQIEEAIKLSEKYSNIEYRVCGAEDIDYEDKSFDVITACQCFWYFDPKIIVPKIKNFLKEDGMFMKIYMSYLKDDPIASKSNILIKSMNNNWTGASASVKDLTTHYFKNPHMESFFIDIPFTKKSWTGRMKASRGVMASMNKGQIKIFEERHMKMLEEFPMEFTIRHKVFLTYYYRKDMKNI